MRRWRIPFGEPVRLPSDREEVREDDGMYVYYSRSKHMYYAMKQNRRGDWLVEEIPEKEYCDDCD